MCHKVKNQHRWQNKSASFPKGTTPEPFPENEVQQDIISGAQNILFLCYQNYKCSSENTYCLQISLSYIVGILLNQIEMQKSGDFVILFPPDFLYCLYSSPNVPVDKQSCLFSFFSQMISCAPTLPKFEGAATLRK